MANSDYTVRSLAESFSPMARLSADIEHLDSAVAMVDFTSPSADGIRIGMAAMIDDEIVSVLDRVENALTLGRGCCDTVPAPHLEGAAIWFFDDTLGTDRAEFGATETISVKVIPRTTSGTSLAIASSPPNELVFNWRFARPYPPGKLEVNGDPWFEPVVMDITTDRMEITWTHRDRITQQDQLLVHGDASVGPETGVTYSLKVYNSSDVLKYETTTEDTEFTYLWFEAAAHFGNVAGLHEAYMIVTAVRDGLTSFQDYRIDFEFQGTGAPQPYGLGYRLGESLGGVEP